MEGGSSNNYDYADQDPINEFDLSGQCPICAFEIGDAIFVAGGAGLAAMGLIQHRPHLYVPHFSNPFGGNMDDRIRQYRAAAYAQASAYGYASFRAGERSGSTYYRKKNTSSRYASERAARQAARRDANNGGPNCKFRPQCSKREYHVETSTSSGTRVHHYKY